MRYLAQRVGTWKWLSVDLERFQTDGPEFVLNGFGVMKARIAPSYGRVIAEDGHPLFEKWSTIIHAESTFERWTGVVSDINPEDGRLVIEVTETPGYMHDLTFTGRIWGVRADPADLVRSIVTQTQAHSNGDLGLRVTGATPRRIGTNSDDLALEAKRVMDAAKKALDARTKPRQAKSAEIQKKNKPHQLKIRALDDQRIAAQKEVDRLVKDKASKTSITAAKSVVTSRNNALKAARLARDNEIRPLQNQLEVLRAAEEPLKAPYERAKEAHQKAAEKARADGGAHKVLAADHPDTWKAVAELLELAPMDLTVHSSITDGKPDVELRLHYPSVGGTREDLLFSQDTNIVSTLVPDFGEHSSEVIALGAGQGDDALRVEASFRDHRLRRNVVIEDKRVTKRANLQNAARLALAELKNPWTIPDIRVRDHPNCRIGAWSVGDHILIQGQAQDIGPISEWHRITAWRYAGPDEAVIELERSNLL